MTTAIITTAVFIFVVGVLALVGFGLYKCTPLVRRANPYRDSVTGRRQESPHVDEFRDFA